MTWVGEVALTRTIAVSDGTSLNISGSSSGGSVVDGDEQNQLFNVSGGSTLGLQGLSLFNGASWDGGAVGLSGSSSLEIVDCSFDGNTADNDGGMITLRQDHFETYVYTKENREQDECGIHCAGFVFESRNRA